MPQDRYQLLEGCIVRINLRGGGYGTGFFVAPGRILTCAHVVGDTAQDGDQFSVRQGATELSANLVTRKPVPPFPAEGASIIFPDLALLRTETTTPPCVLLTPGAEPGDMMYTFGFSQDYPDGEPTTLKHEGDTGGPQTLMKLKEGQIVPGMSGGPLLNVRTGGVCGIVKRSRDVGSDLGGRAVPVEVVLEAFPDLVTLQSEYHQQHREWSDLLGARAANISAKTFDMQRRQQKIREAEQRLRDKDEEIAAVDGSYRAAVDDLSQLRFDRQRTMLDAERAEIEAELRALMGN